ncbi:MAG: dTDP-4-dehydrorhamnose reductase [Flavobacteriales bacterium]|nr:dTDP-4-dehydrorhamnose reductase [Flavobacteriales bacterium]MCW8912389.1 dTDP-4-dehydrorhamnose reductase [Flavobacteriales bacterium]MCW8936473.1 dTDP-4-dehydrorhamnose reductase [Flavobacteriales bacterium]MCW8941090.1 dTDP-4-dehydrorhamnose reductase [Flavobacteriales bacterium]MCW8967539.1 dTDP-4-dehydrorhamnose reductase [Flavobacteriales bacterium]
MKILITGSNGLLGQKLVALLANKEGIMLLATSKGANRISNTNGYQYQSLDITNENEVAAIFNTFKPDTVINTAAMTNVDSCESLQKECWELNVTAVEYLIKYAEQHQAHLIHLSTDFVFDGENGPYKETDQANPLSYYGKSKLAAEKLVKQANTKWSIVRTIIVYGVAENMSRSNIVLWAKQALEKGDPLTIVDDQFRSPTLAEDLAMGCWLITEKQATGVFHLSGKDVMSIIELVYRVADFYGYDKSNVQPIKSSSLNQAAKRPPKTGFVLNKAINELGYNPCSFEEGLAIIDEQLKKIG